MNEWEFRTVTILAQDLDPTIRSTERQVSAPVKAATAHLAATKRVLLSASAILLAGGAMAAIIALKTAIYFARFRLGAG